MGVHKIIIFICLFIFISSLKYVGQSDTTYNKETGQYEFKLYFTNPSAIDDNIMFSFSQGEDADGNEENVVFCEINPIERRLLRSLNIRKLADVEITANCFYETIKDPDKQLIFDNPEIRGVNGDIEIEGDFTVYFKKPGSSIPKILSTINNLKSTIQNTETRTTIISKLNPSSLLKPREELIQTIIKTTTPSKNANNTNLNSGRIYAKPSGSGLSVGQILAIVIPCILLLIGAIIAAALIKSRCSGAPPPMANISTPNYIDTSSLAKVNVYQETLARPISTNPVQPQITNINNPVVNRVFEPVTAQIAQTVPVQQVQVPVQEVQAVPVQEITQVQVPMTHIRGVSSSTGFAGAPQ